MGAKEVENGVSSIPPSAFSNAAPLKLKLAKLGCLWAGYLYEGSRARAYYFILVLPEDLCWLTVAGGLGYDWCWEGHFLSGGWEMAHVSCMWI